MTDDTQISEREREILRLVATGATNQQIAQQLNISINTVKVHLRNIFGKIGVVSRTEATLYAVRAGLISVDRSVGPVAVADEPEPARSPIVVAEPPPAVPPAPVEPAAEVVEAPAEPVAELPAPVEPAAERVVVSPEPRAEPAPPIIVVPPVAPPTPPEPAPAPAPARTPLLLGLAALAIVGALIAGVLVLRPAPAPPATPTSPAAGPAGDSRWRRLADLPQARSAFGLAAVGFEGRQYIYAIGGDDGAAVSADTLRYDVAGDRWVNFRAKPTPAADVRAVVVGSRIYVPGGRAADGSVSAAFEAYDPQRDAWAALADLPAPRSRYALAAVEGKIYLFGGWDGQAYRAEVFQYSPDADRWVELTPMGAPRADAGAAAVQGAVYVVGGSDESGLLTRNERYTPANEGVGNPWSIGAPLPGPRAQAGVAASNAFIFVIGGVGSANLLSYNADQDAWTAFELPPEAPLDGLSGARAQSLGGMLYIFGGAGEAGDPSAGAFEYRALYIQVLPST